MPTRKNKELAEALSIFLDKYNADEFFVTCLSCVHWHKEVCLLNGQKPPAVVIIAGCECYCDKEEIPF